MELNFTKVEQSEVLSFDKSDFENLGEDKLMININWGASNGRSVDLDTNLAVIAEMERESNGFLGFFKNKSVERACEHFIYYANRFGASNAGIVHKGDDMTGCWSDGEFIEIDLGKVPTDLELVPSVVSYSGDDISGLPFAHMRVYIGTAERVSKPLFEVDLTGVKRGTRSAIFGKLFNEGGEWKWKTNIYYSPSRNFGDIERRSVEV